VTGILIRIGLLYYMYIFLERRRNVNIFLNLQVAIFVDFSLLLISP
jgi:hypothetical protein